MSRLGRALSALRTPENPPGPTRLKPLRGAGAQGTDGLPDDDRSAIDVDAWDACEWVKLAEVKRLGVRPDDVVLVRLGKGAGLLAPSALEQVADEVKAMFPDNRVFLFTLDGDVSVDGSAETAVSLRLLEQAEKQTAALEDFTKVARGGFEAFTGCPSLTTVTATPEMLDAIGKAATAGCAKQKRERIYVLAANAEHARSFGQDWADAKPGRDPRYCIDLLDHLPGSPIHRMPVSPVIRLARSEGRRGFDEWLAFLGSRGTEVRCAEEVAACAL